MSALASMSAPQSGHRRQRQPDVDRELRQAARALPRRRLPPFRRRRRQMRPQQPPHAHLSTTRRTTLSVPAAAESSQPRTSPASSAQRSASIGATTLHLQPLVEPLGGRLVGDRQQDGQRQLGRTRPTVAPRRTRRHLADASPAPDLHPTGSVPRPQRRARSRSLGLGVRSTATKWPRARVSISCYRRKSG